MPKIAVVTGGARRIGRSIVEHLHQAGFDVAVHFGASEREANVLAETLNGTRVGSCEVFKADLENPLQVARLGEKLLARYPCIDLLVNNASGFRPTPIASCTPVEFDSMLASNLRAPFLLTQALLPGLRQSLAGNVINIVDTHAERPLKNYSAYSAAKAGLVSLTRSMALELGPDIRVNGIAPGAILWPEGDEAYDQEARQKTVAATPLQRVGTAQDVALTVAFLACDAPFITGEIIVLDGGRQLSN